jgi:hypothetical protein
MKKKIIITRDEWHKLQEEDKKMGAIDFDEIRTDKMWNDPTVKDEDIPCDRFTWDKELKTFVYAGSLNTRKH